MFPHLKILFAMFGKMTRPMTTQTPAQSEMRNILYKYHINDVINVIKISDNVRVSSITM